MNVVGHFRILPVDGAVLYVDARHGRMRAFQFTLLKQLFFTQATDCIPLTAWPSLLLPWILSGLTPG